MIKFLRRFGMITVLVLAALLVFNTTVSQANIVFSSFTYTLWYSRSDPINVVWYDEGSAWDVNFDLRYWVGRSWSDTRLGTRQQVYFWNSYNGGRNQWGWDDYQMQDPDGSFWNRIHLRIFDSDWNDPDWADEWGVGGAHREHWETRRGNHVVDSWEDGEDAVEDAFRWRWFVGSIWYADLGNRGTYNGQWNGGVAPIIDLNY